MNFNVFLKHQFNIQILWQKRLYNLNSEFSLLNYHYLSILLPYQMRELNDIEKFKKSLKTYLFKESYGMSGH